MTKAKIRRKNLEVVHVDSQFRCTKCGRIGTVGRCCGRDTREVYKTKAADLGKDNVYRNHRTYEDLKTALEADKK